MENEPEYDQDFRIYANIITNLYKSKYAPAVAAASGEDIPLAGQLNPILFHTLKKRRLEGPSDASELGRFVYGAVEW